MSEEIVTPVNEESVVPEVVIPVLLDTQKLLLRDAQVQVLKLREQSRQLIEQSQSIEKDIVAFINRACTSLKVDTASIAFNIDTLEFYKLEKKADPVVPIK